MADRHANFLLDLGTLIREQASTAAESVRSAKGTPEESFELGRAFAYYEITSLIKQQAAAFELGDSEVSFAGFTPDSLLGNGV